ncbi:hypothetical protein [Deinococcus apachensis]|uniref:hypothetical protein n=1 Tax=Deinococcus apachensis TaxID=309886 RepID=UPI0012FA10E4|nr:hypothetical protein [Deinococcus apachensis]
MHVTRSILGALLGFALLGCSASPAPTSEFDWFTVLSKLRSGDLASSHALDKFIETENFVRSGTIGSGDPWNDMLYSGTHLGHEVTARIFNDFDSHDPPNSIQFTVHTDDVLTSARSLQTHLLKKYPLQTTFKRIPGHVKTEQAFDEFLYARSVGQDVGFGLLDVWGVNIATVIPEFKPRDEFCTLRLQVERDRGTERLTLSLTYHVDDE